VTPTWLSRGIAGIALSGCLFACNADPGIEYVDCVSPKTPYVETFEGTKQTLADRCWGSENSAEHDVKIGQDHDLIITHNEAVAWDGAPPIVFRHLEGDFVMVTKTEASSGLNSNFCDMKAGDASGILVEGEGVRATFLVRPELEAPGVTCEDESEHQPLALAFAQSSASPEPTPTPTGIGVDGEADIAVCRRDDRLAYFYRDAADPEADWLPEDWKQLKADDGTGKTDVVGLGPLDVGVTTTVSETGVPLGIEGHFNWVAVLDLSEDCLGPLQELEEPEGG
jgi:hypothetical protein